MANMKFISIALVAFVCLGFAIPSQAISLAGVWEGQCTSKSDYNDNCLPKGLVSSYPFYLTISTAAGGKYKFDERADTTTELGRLIRKSYKSSYTLGLQGNPNGNAVCVEDTDGHLPSFSVRLDRVGQNDVLTIESSMMVDEGQVCSFEHKPLYCHITRDTTLTEYSNEICVLFRKGADN